MTTEPKTTSGATAPLQDHRQKPRGVIPRQVQTWLMVIIAVIILLIIVLAGHPPMASAQPAGQRPAQAALPASERIRVYQQQLKDDEARLQHLQAQEATALGQALAPPPTATASAAVASGAVATDPTADEQRRREYQSLFADNVALSRRAAGQQPTGDTGQRRPNAATSSVLSPETLAAWAALTQAQVASVGRGGGPQAAPSSTMEDQPKRVSSAPPPNAAPTQTPAEHPAPGPRLPLLEGTVIETVLLNRLDGTLAGPVECLVTTPVYSHDRQVVLIPAGARVLGSAAPVQAWGDARLAVSFTRLVMPDGHSYRLDVFKGLDQSGATGVKDEVNRHYLQVFGASLAIGAVSGLAQYGTQASTSNSFGDAYRQSTGSSLATSTSHVLDRYLNVLPTLTIREGFRIKVYLMNDFALPAYAAAGGVS